MAHSLQLPEGIRQLANQVAGHTFQSETNALGLLQDASSACVLKPYGKPACGEREAKFYKTLFSTEDPVLAQARLLVPKFYEKVQLSVNQRDHIFLKLEDLTFGLKKPCIMDIKIGKRTWDPVATEEKRAVEEEKYAQCKQVLGLCVPGFQVYTVNSNNSIRHGKEYGKLLNAKSFRTTMSLFLNTQPDVCEPLIHEILNQLYAIRNWFSRQRIYHFYASSLLIAYDFEVLQQLLAKKTQNGKRFPNGSLNGEFADTASNNDSTNYKFIKQFLVNPSEWIKVKMIDFAHVFPAENDNLDMNYLFGLQSLIAVIEDLVR